MILITCDTLRADHLGVYGYRRPTSPAIDAFARESVVFEDCSATSSITGPSLSALMTGLYPDELGAYVNHLRMPPDAITVADLASRAGYPTAAVVSNPVLKHYPDLGNVGVVQGFEHFDDEMKAAEANRPHLKERVAPDTTRAAIDWLTQQQAAGDDGFFLWVHYQDPHGPYTAPQEFVDLFHTEYETDTRLPLGKKPWGLGQIPDYQILGPADAPFQHPGIYRDRYDAEIRYFDQAFGELIGWLRSVDWLEDSLVIFTADHGEAMGENGYWFSHGETVHRGVIRVPLVVRYPAGAPRPAGQRVASCVSHLDLWPTFLEAFGFQERPNRGTSLFAESLPSGRNFYYAIRQPDHQRRREGIGNCNFRMLFGSPSSNAMPQLFDITSDPNETKDVVGERSGPTTGLLQSYREIKASLQEPLRPTLVDFKAEELQAIGYTGAEGDQGD